MDSGSGERDLGVGSCAGKSKNSFVQGERVRRRKLPAQTGHIQVDLVRIHIFSSPRRHSAEQTRDKIRDNVAKLVAFSVSVAKNSGTSSRLLWSESEESLAQKLIARLQKVQ